MRMGKNLLVQPQNASGGEVHQYSGVPKLSRVRLRAVQVCLLSETGQGVPADLSEFWRIRPWAGSPNRPFDKILRIFSKIPQAPAKNLCDDRRAVQRGPAWEAGPAAI